MATVHFTSHLQKFAPCAPVQVGGETIGAALQAALADSAQLRSYVLDEQGHLRRHMTVYIDGQLIADRVGLSDPIHEHSELYVMQALSGG
jgi:molybdopterin converting factor small subunit